MEPLNSFELSWLNEIYETLLNKDQSLSFSLAEIGVLCPRDKKIKSKCKKLSALLRNDNRFTVNETDHVSINNSISHDKNNLHKEFLYYISEKSETDIIISEHEHHLNIHFQTWVAGVSNQGISLDLNIILERLKLHQLMTVHEPTSRIILETKAGRMASRIAELDSSTGGGKLDLSNTTDSASSAPGVLLGDSWKNAKFTDQTEFEESMFGDTGADHSYEVRSKTYLDDKEKDNTGVKQFLVVTNSNAML